MHYIYDSYTFLLARYSEDWLNFWIFSLVSSFLWLVTFIEIYLIISIIDDILLFRARYVEMSGQKISSRPHLVHGRIDNRYPESILTYRLNDGRELYIPCHTSEVESIPDILNFRVKNTVILRRKVISRI